MSIELAAWPIELILVRGSRAKYVLNYHATQELSQRKMQLLLSQRLLVVDMFGLLDIGLWSLLVAAIELR